MPDGDATPDADFYWRRAAELRGNAYMTRHAWLRTNWLTAADHLERLALDAERVVPSHVRREN